MATVASGGGLFPAFLVSYVRACPAPFRNSTPISDYVLNESDKGKGIGGKGQGPREEEIDGIGETWVAYSTSTQFQCEEIRKYSYFV